VVAFPRAPLRRNLLDQLLVLKLSEESAYSVDLVLEESVESEKEDVVRAESAPLLDDAVCP
jgi:hypothetical protein